MLNKFIAITALYAVSIGVGALTMIHGWGIEPKSWGWIIGSGVVGRLIVEICVNISKTSE